MYRFSHSSSAEEPLIKKVIVDFSAALKVMLPILLCWPMISEADGGMALGAEPSHQCYIAVLLLCDR